MVNLQTLLKQQLGSFMAGVYGWVAVGLSVTSIVSYVVAHTPALFLLIQRNPFLLFGIILVQFALTLMLVGLYQRLNFPVAAFMFLALAATFGFTLSVIFYVYTFTSIVTTFITAAAMFAGMAAYGYMTSADLTSVGSTSIMILWGMIVAMFINFFLQSPVVDLLLSGVGVVIFSLLTAYDTQRIKNIGAELLAHNESIAKVTLIGALVLFLDFINLFLYLLRFLGRRRED